MFGQIVQAVTNLPHLVYVAIALASLLYLKTRSRIPDNIPPFPVRPYPIMGHSPMLGSGVLEKLNDWKKKSNIFSLYIGSKLFVVISSFDILKDAFVKKADYFSDRPSYFATDEEKKHGACGIVSNSGPGWKEQRTLALTILRDLGMGKNWLAEKISEEVEAYLAELSSFKGESREVEMLTNKSVSNVICTILIGERFEYNDPYFDRLIYLMKVQLSFAKGSAIQLIFPWLRFLPGDLFNIKKIQTIKKEMDEHFRMKVVKEHRIEEDYPDCFVRAYYLEMKQRQEDGRPTSLDFRNLVRSVGNMFSAGSDTTSATILWAMLYTLHYPECQEKINKEIQDVIGTDRIPNIQDKPKMPYMAAFIMEAQRLGSVLPLAIPHWCNETLELAGYTIPKGTTIWPNLNDILRDPNVFKDPFEFRPERFLDNDNKVIVPEQFIPFSIGRRLCLGESLAKVELFLFMTGIFQRFHLKPDDPDNLPPIKNVFGLTQSPENFKIRFIEKMERS